MISEVTKSEMNDDRSFPDRGINPTNRNLLRSKPDSVKATITLEGPGMDSIFIFLCASAATNSEPGSAISGVPASESKATSLPESSKFSISFNFSSSFPRKYDYTGFFIFR